MQIAIRALAVIASVVCGIFGFSELVTALLGRGQSLTVTIADLIEYSVLIWASSRVAANGMDGLRSAWRKMSSSKVFLIGLSLWSALVGWDFLISSTPQDGAFSRRLNSAMGVSLFILAALIAAFVLWTKRDVTKNMD